MLKCLLLAIFLSSSAEYSSSMPLPLTVKGVVVSFDEKIITIKQTNGAIVYVPRTAKPKLQGVRMNKDVLTFHVRSSEFLKLNYKSLGLPKPSE